MTKSRYPEPQYAKPISNAVLGLARAMCKDGTLKNNAVSHFSASAPLQVEIDYEKADENAWKGYGKFRDEMEKLGFLSSRCQRMASDGTDKASLTFTIPDELESVEKITNVAIVKLNQRLKESIRKPVSEARELIDSILPGKAGPMVKKFLLADIAKDLGIPTPQTGRGVKG